MRVVLVLLIAAPFLVTGWAHGDGIGYVAMLRSAVVDHDLDLRNEYAHLSTHMQADATGWPAVLMRRGGASAGLDPTWQTPAPDPVTGRTPAYYSVGPPIAWAPAYALARALTRIAGGRPAPADDGYGGLEYVAIALSTLAFGVAGLLLAYHLARVAAPEHEAWWSVLALTWAAPLVYYLYFAPDYSHALSVLSSGAFFLAWWRDRHADRPSAWFRWGALAGLLFLVRWSDVVLALPAFALEAAGLLRRNAAAGPGRAAGRLAACTLAAAAGALLLASPQLAAWQYFHGRPWVRYPEPYVGLPLHGLLATLFSDRHGLFVWTPVTLPAVVGLLLLLRRQRELAGVALASLALLVVANCTAPDWWGGASFGMRRLVSGTPLFVLGLAVALEAGGRALGGRRRPTAVWLAPVAALVFSAWNLGLLGQYALGMIDHNGPVSAGRIAANQLLVRVLHLLEGRTP
jgi:hypothetical protein